MRSLEEALDVADLQDREMLAEYEQPTFGRVRAVGLPLRLTDHQPAYRAAPLLGADTDDIVRELGYDEAALEGLRERGAFGRLGAGLGDREVPAEG